MEMSIYWNRGAVGLKVPLNGKKVQKLYFSAGFCTIGVNILQGAKVAEFLRGNSPEFAESEEVRTLHGKVVFNAGVAHDRYEEQKAKKLAEQQPAAVEP